MRSTSRPCRRLACVVAIAVALGIALTGCSEATKPADTTAEVTSPAQPSQPAPNISTPEGLVAAFYAALAAGDYTAMLSLQVVDEAQANLTLDDLSDADRRMFTNMQNYAASIAGLTVGTAACTGEVCTVAVTGAVDGEPVRLEAKVFLFRGSWRVADSGIPVAVIFDGVV